MEDKFSYKGYCDIRVGIRNNWAVFYFEPWSFTGECIATSVTLWGAKRKAKKYMKKKDKEIFRYSS